MYYNYLRKAGTTACQASVHRIGIPELPYPVGSLTIIQRDVDSVVARIMVMLSNDQFQRELVAQKDVGAQALLNLLQEVKKFYCRLPADTYAPLSLSIWNILSTPPPSPSVGCLCLGSSNMRTTLSTSTTSPPVWS
jgi:hypothetical protein